MLENIAKFHIL